MRQNQAEPGILRRWRFGGVEFDERELALKLDGSAVEIEPKPLLVLRHLLEHAGEVVTKDALIRAVWPGRIITDAALAKSVGRLREALRDREQVIVRTHHGFGYRLVAPIKIEVLEREPAVRPAAALAALPMDSAAAEEKEAPSRRDAERRPITVLFCDLVDSTQLADTLDPEAFRELLIAYRRRAHEIGTRYEAHLAQQSGDGLLMYFGYPAAHDDDAERAVRCACELLAASKRQRSAPAVPLSLRIGIHSGAVVIGELVGDQGQGGELLATGSGLHLAARLQALAEPDTILMSEATFRLVPGLFVTRDYGPQLIRGLAKPVRVHQAIHPSGVRSRLAAARLTPFVGRESELDLIETCWRDAVNGEGRAILLSAEPGLGKSRLLMEIRARLAGSSYSWHECRADALNRHSAYHPVIDLIRSGLALKDGDDEALRLGRLETGFADIALDCAEAVPLIGPLLGIAPTARYPLSPLAPAQQRRRALELLVEWIERLAHQQPLVIAFEDLHWCDDSSLEFLGVLIERLPRLPILLVMTTRLEFTPPWPTRATLHLHRIEPLPLWEVERMLGALAGAATLAPSLSLLIYERAGGVPLFVEELTRSLIESGQIIERADTWEARVPLGQLAIPVSLHGLLLARLDRLGTARELIQMAAVIGREIPHRLLQLVAGLDEATLRERLSRLCESGLLHACGKLSDASYVFKHALIRDSAYETLLKSTQQRWHGVVAKALEAGFPDLSRNEPQVLAAHFEKAALTDRAAYWYAKASEKAVAASSYGDAIRHGEHALELLAGLAGDASRDRLELELLVLVGAAKIAVFGRSHPGLEPILARSADLRTRVADEQLAARSLANLAMTHFGAGDYVAYAQVGEQFLRLPDKAGSQLHEAAGHMLIAQSHYYRGAPNLSHRHAERAIRAYDDTSSRDAIRLFGMDGLTAVLAMDTTALALSGYNEQALRRNAEMLVRAEATGHPLSIGAARSRQAWVFILSRRPQRAQDLAQMAASFCERHGFEEWKQLALLQLGLARCMLGQFEQGIELVRSSRISQRTGRPLQPQAFFCGLEAEACIGAGRLGDAEAALAEALQALGRGSEGFWEAELHRLRAELLLVQEPGRPQGAETCFRQALDLSRRQQAKLLELRAATGLARLQHAQGQSRQADDTLRPVYGWFTEGLDTRDPKDARALLAQMA